MRLFNLDPIMGLVDSDMLSALRLIDEKNNLTQRGREIEERWWIERRPEAAMPAVAESFKNLPATQAMVQILHGRVSLPFDGVLYHLQRHGLAGEGDKSAFRSFVSLLNQLGLVSYSNKHQTIRLTMPVPSEPEKVGQRVRVVEPDRPYANVRSLREILRECRDYIWWCDPQFGKKGLEPLHDEADATLVKTIRILSGHHQINKTAETDFERFKAEMSTLGISAEWLIVEAKQRTWHDRFIITKGKAWNVPPVNTLFKNDYSEISLTDHRPPFEGWWRTGVTIDEWIKEHP